MSVTYNVRDYGAVGDGATNDAEAIRRALDAAAKRDSSPASDTAPEGTEALQRATDPAKGGIS